MVMDPSCHSSRIRKNGQPQACEPCRKSKVRCNHGTPNCSRCTLRALDCTYHPAPMTKLDRLLQPSLSTLMNTQVTGTTQSQALSSPAAMPLPIDTPPTSTSSTSARTSVSHDRSYRSTIFQKEGVSYGTTRFSAVFTENQASFGAAILDVADDNRPPSRSHTSHSDPEASSLPEMGSSPYKDLALETLMYFPTARTCELLIKDLSSMLDVWMSPVMIKQCLSQIWAEYGHLLGDNRSRASLSTFVDDLFENGKQPLPVPENDHHDGSDDWRNWFGGPRLRWEMIGILFCWAGMVFKHKQEWDLIFDLPEQEGRNRNTAADKMRECAAACLKFCDDYAEINDIVVCFMKNCGKLQSIIISDESDRVRIDYGTVGSAFITAGLHRLPNAEKVTPLSQYRASISSSMYYLDKGESLFNGRPPMLNSRYCHCPLPLDLSEDDVYSGASRLDVAIAKLDDDGWNTDKKIYTTTWIRSLSLLSPIREGILELSLSVNTQFTKSQVDVLVSKLDQIVESYPTHIQYHANSQWSQRSSTSKHGRGAREMYIITRIQLDVLQCRFLLCRLLISRAFSNGQKLFDVAQEMMSAILSIWLNRDQIQDFTHAFDWIVISYGVPCASVLCIELLRASNLATPDTDSSSSTAKAAPIRISTSEVIQTLTIFVTFLDWIRPTDNNVQFCGRFKRVIKKIIDTVFDSFHRSQSVQIPQQQVRQFPHSVPGTQEVLPPEPLQQQYQNIDSFVENYDPAFLPMDDLDWLNNVDWTKNEWLGSC